jgi:hypothetical protein
VKPRIALHRHDIRRCWYLLWHSKWFQSLWNIFLIAEIIKHCRIPKRWRCGVKKLTRQIGICGVATKFYIIIFALRLPFCDENFPTQNIILLMMDWIDVIVEWIFFHIYLHASIIEQIRNDYHINGNDSNVTGKGNNKDGYHTLRIAMAYTIFLDFHHEYFYSWKKLKYFSWIMITSI